MRHVRICTILATAIICMTAACTDKGKGPTDVQYRLLAGPSYRMTEAEDTYAYLFDTETDSLADSIACEEGAGYPSGGWP